MNGTWSVLGFRCGKRYWCPRHQPETSSLVARKERPTFRYNQYVRFPVRHLKDSSWTHRSSQCSTSGMQFLASSRPPSGSDTTYSTDWSNLQVNLWSSETSSMPQVLQEPNGWPLPIKVTKSTCNGSMYGSFRTVSFDALIRDTSLSLHLQNSRTSCPSRPSQDSTASKA